MKTKIHNRIRRYGTSVGLVALMFSFIFLMGGQQTHAFSTSVEFDYEIDIGNSFIDTDPINISIGGDEGTGDVGFDDGDDDSDSDNDTGDEQDENTNGNTGGENTPTALSASTGSGGSMCVNCDDNDNEVQTLAIGGDQEGVVLGASTDTELEELEITVGLLSQFVQALSETVALSLALR